MDPDKTLEMIDACLGNWPRGPVGDRDGALEFATYLKGWLSRGGFEPRWSEYPAAASWYRAIAPGIAD